MKYYPLLIIYFITTACVASSQPAGVIIISHYNNDTLVLIADHKIPGRGWASFGGGQQANESTQQTAAREAYEETRGVYDQQTITNAIQQAPQVIISDAYTSYVIELPYVTAETFTNKIVSTMSFNERGPYLWISLEDLMSSIANNETATEFIKRNDIVLWDRFIDVLRQVDH